MCNGLVSLLPKQYASVHYTTVDSVYIFNMTRFKKKIFIHIPQGHENRKYIKDRCMSVGLGSLAIGLNSIRMELIPDSFPEALSRSLFYMQSKKVLIKSGEPRECWFSMCLQVTLDGREGAGEGQSCRREYHEQEARAG